MGSYVSPGDESDEKPQGNYALTRQPSIYSLTLDEFQNTLGDQGKDFGSMNMDELLKNIWTAEETQAMTSLAGGRDGNVLGGNLQRQGSLTLPWPLSQKTVDEVWRDLIRESGWYGALDGSVTGRSNLPQAQQTLGEMTLEEFLMRAGALREDIELTRRLINSGFYGELSQPNDNNSLAFEFQQPSRSNGVFVDQIIENNNSIPTQPTSLALNAGRVRSPHQQIQQQQQPLFPKPSTLPFASPLHQVNNAQLACPQSRSPVVGVAKPTVNTGLVQSGRISKVGLGPGAVSSVAGSAVSQVSSDVIANSGVHTASVPPVSYVFSQERRCGASEKVVERRQRRMIKNRESAARSRARKQAYTMELEAEVAKLKEMNQELQEKQEEIMEMQNNQELDKMNQQWVSERQCLRRTLTGPW
ncbi:hypothetical protein I3760_06G173400 [Carya illinoinensis]|uniref:BZIP domain-containing protein n=1 Tax=Carya illinoinensis TaxID=32201 RepID=A0A8T1QDD1_CARIL|nr:ABSCISIC ACID-INSENSITIVE 5-like protein 6 isoform X1 [Carya illinoinensis]XP_042984053.1 ABSCISIC ACID-INSENSITIVE 5-like protein 6 isoform X1 [Carya illinoinensis]XP_042984055.1 ABSCISIC ACID-INSENSITIVE 5-like protein 6 isoform X1 [Carya illinoinensis]KAG2704192.1 hypothetical protein I3760_06G173400 [Carya illinoinensis]KAG6652262.1 hypothetical protein CIPAW_06G172000 [Carya illinoinensis]KAG6652263.1 hypothetical protein CIPAW_06G172000 [Carya illinoinensis]KAG6710219.1 hypothetical 